MKKSIFSVIALAATFGLGSIALADGHNGMGDMGGGNGMTPGLMAGGTGFGTGGFNAGGFGGNNGLGEVVDRGSFNESGGNTVTNFSFNATTCDDAPCVNFAQISGLGTASNRGGSFIQTLGGYAESGVHGGAEVGVEVGAISFYGLFD